VVSEKGYGKRSDIDGYRITNRGGKGVKTINITDKTGTLIALKDVTDTDDLMIITQYGNILRSPVAALRVMGRATQGVRLINLKENDSIGSVACVVNNEEDGSAEKDNPEENISKSDENGKEFED
jgi:DNA gyrase subunit A